MELKDIKDLMSAMRRGGTKRLKIKDKEFELELEREDLYAKEGIPQPVIVSSPIVHSEPHTKAYHDIPAALHPPMEQKEKLAVEETGNYVTSPMVGTFYATPSPDDPIFVKVGDDVEEQTVVCIVEAMKVMNEVKAGVRGRVVEVMVESGQPVEFGTKLFRIS